MRPICRTHFVRQSQFSTDTPLYQLYELRPDDGRVSSKRLAATASFPGYGQGKVAMMLTKEAHVSGDLPAICCRAAHSVPVISTTWATLRSSAPNDRYIQCVFMHKLPVDAAEPGLTAEFIYSASVVTRLVPGHLPG